MEVSKQCKICWVADDDCIPIAGEYSGKYIPKLMAKICHIELDHAKIQDLIICLPCVQELLRTEILIDKLRVAVREFRKDVVPASCNKKADSVTNGTILKTTLSPIDENHQPRRKPKPKLILNCKICGKGYSRKQQLRRHVDLCRKGQKLQECPKCQMEIYSRQKHEKHICKPKAESGEYETAAVVMSDVQYYPYVSLSDIELPKTP